MRSKQAIIYMIVISIIAAAAIVISSDIWVESAQTIMYYIIAVWFVPFTWLAARAGNDQSGAEQ